MFSQSTLTRKTAVLSVAGVCVFAAAAPQADAAFTYLSSTRSVFSESTGTLHGPSTGTWDIWAGSGWASTANQTTTVSADFIRGDAITWATSDSGNGGLDHTASSELDVVFTTDAACSFTFYIQGSQVADVSLWRVDAVTLTETLVASTMGWPTSVYGTIDAGSTYHLSARALTHPTGGQNLVQHSGWTVAFPNIPAPGGVSLAAPLAMMAARRRRSNA